MQPILMFQLTAPVAAKKNRFRAAVTKYGRPYQYQDSKIKVRQQDIKFEALEAIRKLPQTVQFALPFTEGCKVEIAVNRGHADVIGASETILDALEHILYKNDRQALELHAWHTKELPSGIYAIVKVYPFPAKTKLPLSVTDGDFAI